MDVFVWLPLVIPVIAALAARPLAERLPPRTATWLLAASAVILAGASCGALGLLALAAAVRVPFVAAAEGMSIRAVNSMTRPPSRWESSPEPCWLPRRLRRCGLRGCGLLPS
jgi:hypothetical protein